MTTEQRLARLERECQLFKAGFALVPMGLLVISLHVVLSGCGDRMDDRSRIIGSWDFDARRAIEQLKLPENMTILGRPIEEVVGKTKGSLVLSWLFCRDGSGEISALASPVRFSWRMASGQGRVFRIELTDMEYEGERATESWKLPVEFLDSDHCTIADTPFVRRQAQGSEQ